MAHRFQDYQPYKGPIPGRPGGVMVSQGTGTAVAYSMFKLQDRGKFIIEAGSEVYGGQVVGVTARSEELVINLQKSKQLTNIRASGTDESIVMEPPVRLSLEQSLEFIEGDEYVEVTPQSIRIRKIYLDENERKRHAKKVMA